MQAPPRIGSSAPLDTSAKREVLRPLEKALAQPRNTRKAWLERKLSERRAVGHRVRCLLETAKRYLSLITNE